MLVSLLLLTADVLSLGRVHKADMPQQTLCELLVAGLDTVDGLQNSNSEFHSIEHWRFLSFDPKGNVISIKFEFGALGDMANELAIAEDVFGEDEVPDFIHGYTVSECGAIDLAYIPPTVTKFEANTTNFSGTVETSELPANLEVFDIVMNVFSGEFSIEGLPRKLKDVDISMNFFEGSLNLPALPESMRNFLAMNNKFSGEISLKGLPEGIKNISLEDNALSGSLDMLRLPLSLESINLLGNSFSPKTVPLELSRSMIVALDADMLPVDMDGNAIKDPRIQHNIKNM